MRAGLLTEVIEIHKPQITKSDWGEQSTIYLKDKETRARIINDNGNRNIENDEVVYNYSKTFEVRMYVDVDELDLIKWNNKFWRIMEIELDKPSQTKTVNCVLKND